MKWIEMTPEVAEKISSLSIVRFKHTKKVLCEAKHFISDYPSRINTLEYLDELVADAAREDEAVGFRIWCDENHWVMVAHDLYASIYNQDFGTAEYNVISLKELYKQYKARFTNVDAAAKTN